MLVDIDGRPTPEELSSAVDRLVEWNKRPAESERYEAAMKQRIIAWFRNAAELAPGTTWTAAEIADEVQGID